MNSRVFLFLSAPLVMASCASQTGGEKSITIERYRELEHAAPIQAGQFKIACMLTDGKGDTLMAPAVIAKPGQKAEVAVTRDFVYPDAFELPQTEKKTLKQRNKDGPAAFPVTPTTPRSFQTRETGWKIALAAHAKGAFVVVDGVVSRDEFVGFANGAGEAAAPITADGRIVLTENKTGLPQFKRTEARIYVAGLPDVPHSIRYPALGATLTVTVSAQK